MFHLIGVDHSLAQRKKRVLALTEVQRRYQFVVESAIQSIHPDLLAEEDHPSYLAEDEADSILLPIAEHQKIPHIFVEADRATQASLGYKNLDMLNGLLVARGISSAVIANAHKFAHQFPIRERYLARFRRATSFSSLAIIISPQLSPSLPPATFHTASSPSGSALSLLTQSNTRASSMRKTTTCSAKPTVFVSKIRAECSFYATIVRDRTRPLPARGWA